MTRHIFILLLLSFSFFPSLTSAEDPMPTDDVVIQDFVKGSLQDIKDQYKGKPFILSFWSVDCTYCFDEMKMFSSLKEKYPDLEVVLVSTDVNLDDETVNQVLDETGFEAKEVWVFADEIPARLYADVDENWRGELPNTLFLNSKHEYQSIMGEVKSDLVEKWLLYLVNEKT